MNEYILFMTVDHWEIGQFYLYQFYMPPPWHFAFVMIAAVVPLALMLAAVLGTWQSWKDKGNGGRALGVLFLLNALLPVVVLAIGKSMVYDNDRLMMPAFVFLAALAGVGIDWALGQVSRALKARQREKLIPYLGAGLLALAFLPQLIAAATLYPHLLSYYSASVGGLRGATALGLETTYWCETYNETLDFINANAEPGDSVWVDPYSNDVMTYYQLQGQLRDDVLILMPEWGSTVFGNQARLRKANFAWAEFIVLQYRQTGLVEGGHGYGVLDWVSEETPDIQVAHNGIPLVEVYDMRTP
jgi:hypothetical protein